MAGAGLATGTVKIRTDLFVLLVGLLALRVVKWEDEEVENDAWEWAGDPEAPPRRWLSVHEGWFVVGGCPELLALEQYNLTGELEKEMSW